MKRELKKLFLGWIIGLGLLFLGMLPHIIGMVTYPHGFITVLCIICGMLGMMLSMKYIG